MNTNQNQTIRMIGLVLLLLGVFLPMLVDGMEDVGKYLFGMSVGWNLLYLYLMYKKVI